MPHHLEAALDKLDNQEQVRLLAALRVLNRGYRTNRYIQHLRPNLHPKQEMFLSLNVREVMMGGAAGGAKSDSLLLGALQYVDIPGYSAILLRRNWPDLTQKGALMDRADDWFAQFPDVHRRDGGRRWTFPEGGTISFGHVENMKDAVNKYQSAEFQYIAFDEVTQHDIRVYLYLFSRLRRLKGVDIPLRMRSGTNPGGTFGQEFKSRFVTSAVAVEDTWIPQPDLPPIGAVEDSLDENWQPRSLTRILAEAEETPLPPEDEYLDCEEDDQFSWLWVNRVTCDKCFGSGRMQKNQAIRRGKTECVYCQGTGKQNRYFLPARLQDNPSLDEDEYRQSLALLPIAEQLQLEHGRWDVAVEGHLFRESWVRNFELVRGANPLVKDKREKPPEDESQLAGLIRQHAVAFNGASQLRVYRRNIPSIDNRLQGGTLDDPEVHIDFVPMERIQLFSTWDTASKDDTHHDWTVGGVWGLDVERYDLYLFHVFREKLEIPDILPSMLMLHQEWPCEFAIIEDAASGIGIVQSAGRMQGRGLTVLPYSPHIKGKRVHPRAKVSRATVSIIRMKTGKVYFPTPRPFWWSTFLSELIMFGTEEWETVQQDDQVDMFSMASWFAANRDDLTIPGDTGQVVDPGPPAVGIVPTFDDLRMEVLP